MLENPGPARREGFNNADHAARRHSGSHGGNLRWSVTCGHGQAQPPMGSLLDGPETANHGRSLVSIEARARPVCEALGVRVRLTSWATVDAGPHDACRRASSLATRGSADTPGDTRHLSGQTGTERSVPAA